MERNPPSPSETMGTVNRVLTVWQITSSSSLTSFTLWEQRLCTHVGISPVTALSSHTHTHSPHRSTQCLTFSLNISYDLKICEEGAVTALSFSFFICSLYFDSAWIRTSLYEQTATVLFRVQGLSWEQMKVTHCFHMLMKFPLHMNWLFGPRAPWNVQSVSNGGIGCWHFIMFCKATVDTVFGKADDSFWNFPCRVI